MTIEHQTEITNHNIKVNRKRKEHLMDPIKVCVSKHNREILLYIKVKIVIIIIVLTDFELSSSFTNTM